MKLRKLLTKDKVLAVKLHLENLRDLTAMAGEKYVERLYGKILIDRGIQSYGVFEGRKLIGMISGAVSYHEGEKALSTIIGATDIFLIAVKILQGKITPLRIINRIFFNKKVLNRLPGAIGGIIILCVDKNRRREGLGRMLINSINNYFIHNRVNKVFVDTLDENREAIAFYKSLGFKKVNEKSGGVLMLKEI